MLRIGPALLLLLLGAVAARGARALQPLKVASLSTVTTEIAQKVGGDRVAVLGLVKPGIDPHDYEPTPDDLKAMGASDLVLASGKGLEGYLAKLQQSSGTKASLLRVGDALPGLRSVAGSAHGEDPHWWQSIGAVEKAVRVVRDRLIELRPGDQAVFAQNAAAYLAE